MCLRETRKVGPGARPSRPDRRASGVFARTVQISRHPLDSRRSAAKSVGVGWSRSRCDGVLTARWPPGTDSDNAPARACAQGYWRLLSPSQVLPVAGAVACRARALHRDPSPRRLDSDAAGRPRRPGPHAGRRPQSLPAAAESAECPRGPFRVRATVSIFQVQIV